MRGHTRLLSHPHHLEENPEGRGRHTLVIKALQFMELRLPVPGHLHHAPEAGILLVAAQHLQLPVPGDEHQGRSIGPHVKQRRKPVDHGLLPGNTALFPGGEVRDGVPAEGNEGCDFVSINPSKDSLLHPCSPASSRKRMPP